MKVINEEIKNETYEELIDYAYKKCDAVMFVFRKDGFGNHEIKTLEDTESKLEKQFNSFLLHKFNRPSWVFSTVLNDTYSNKYSEYEFEKLFQIQFYKFADCIKDYLLSNKNLYKWLNPKYPEDVSFFINERCWFTSITHEEMCDIFVESKEEYEYLKSIGIEFLEEEYREIKDNEVFIEKFEN